jgi:hypothetical protein
MKTTQLASRKSCAAWAAACSLLIPCASPAATFLISDVTNWIGPAAGPGISQAVLVLDWVDAQAPFAWGYRWDTSQAKTSADLLTAIIGAEPRLSATISSLGFVSDVGWHANARFQGDYNPTTGAYWNYFVNNAQQAGNYNDGAAPSGAHILPPLGSPYDDAGPGAWVSSNTGILGHPLVDGAWDGFIYADFTASGPSFTANAPASVPEPAGLSTLLFLCVWKRRR